MKKLLLPFVLLSSFVITSFTSSDVPKRYFDKERCVFVIERPYEKPREINLYGRVRVVENFPDITVRIVSGNEDLSVKATSFAPSQCGNWNFVDRSEDFTIKFVDDFPDITIRFHD